MGFWELLFVLVIVLIFFGAGRLPAIGEGLGKAVRAFKAASAPGAGPPPARKKDPPPGADGE